MPIETSKEEICINQIIGQKRETIKVEGDVIVNDIKPDVKTIINTSGIASVYKKEVTDGKIRLDGSINTYVIYLSEGEGEVRSLNTTLDFTQFIEMENCKLGMSVDESVDIKQFECSIINSRKISIKANLDVSVKVYSNERVEIINEIEAISDIQVLNRQIEINSLTGEGNTKAYAKDTLSVEATDDLAEILQVKFNLVDKEEKISYNKILVKTDCDLAIMYLTEDNRINTINAKLPVMGFVDMPNINDESICDVRYKLKNLLVKANNMEKHSIYIEAEIEIICFSYEIKYINIIEDVYATSSNLTYTKKQIRTISEKKNVKEIYNIKEQILLPEVEGNRLYDVAVKPNITDIRDQNGKIIFEGEVELKFLFEFNNIIAMKNINIPFNFEMTQDLIDANIQIEPNVFISKENFIVGANGSIEARN